jgi:hypothetical protein
MSEAALPGSPDSRPATILMVALGLACVVGLAALLLWPGWQRERPQYRPNADPATAGIEGMVVDQDGLPIAGIGVRWFAKVEVAASGLANVHAGSDPVVTDAAGNFRMDALQPGDGYLQLEADAKLFHGRSGEFDLRRGAIAGGLRLRAKALPVEKLLRGRILRQDGTPAAFEPLRLQESSLLGHKQAMVVTDAAGNFEHVGVMFENNCELFWIPSGRAPVKLGAVRFDGTRLELRLPSQ